MATSAEIAQQIADQNSWFMQQNALASQIGVNPAAYGGMGGWGMGGPMMGAPVMQRHPGGPSMPGAFNYGSNPLMGYGFGSRVGAVAGGASAALPVLGTTAAELFSMTKYGAGISPFLNPISGFAAGRAMGFGMMGATAVAGTAMLPLMAAQHVMGSVTHGMQQQSMINTAAGQYQFMNPASRSGMGFTRDDTAAIGGQIRQLAMLPEMMTSMAELTRMMPLLKQSGAMQGVRDAQEFNRRFKEAITTIRDVSKILGTTMEDAGQFFAQSRSVGFYGRNEQVRNALQAQVVRGTTGMGQDQYNAMQQSAAAFGTAIGAPRGVYARGAANIATSLGLAQQAGVIRDGQIEDLTGKQGDAGIADASLRMLNLTTRLAGTGPGRFLLAGAADFDENGRISINKTIMDQYRSGGMTMEQIRQRGIRNMASHRNAIAFEANQAKLAAQFTAEGGAEGFYGLMEGAVGNMHPEAAKLLIMQNGGTEAEAELLQNMFRANQGGQGDANRMMQQIRARQASIRENADPRAVLKRLGTRISNQITAPFEQFGQRVLTGISKSVDNFLDDLVGNYVLTVSEEAEKKYIAAFASGDKSAMGEIFKGKGPTGPTGKPIAGSVGQMLRNSEFGAFLVRGGNNTGRTTEATFRDVTASMGLTGMDISKDTDRQEVARRLKLYDEGSITGLAHQNTQLSNIQGGEAAARWLAEKHRDVMATKEFRNAEPEKQLRMLQEETDKWTRAAELSTGDAVPPGPRGGPIATSRGYAVQAASGANEVAPYKEALLAIKSLGGGAGVTAAAQRYVGGKKNLFRKGGGGGIYFDVSKAAIGLRDAQDEVHALFDDPQLSQAVIKDAKVGGVLSKYLNMTGEEQKKAGDALASGDPELIKAAGLGDVTQTQAGHLSDAYEQVRRDPAKAKTALNNYALALDSKDRVAFGGAMTDTSNAFAAGSKALEGTDVGKAMGEVAAAYKNLAGIATSPDASLDEKGLKAAEVAAQERVRGASNALIQKIRGMKDGAAKDAALAALPEEARAHLARESKMENALSRRSGDISVDELSTEYGLDAGAVREKFGLSSNAQHITLTRQAKKDLAEIGGMQGEAEAVAARAKAQMQEKKDSEMINTLKVIAEAIVSQSNDSGKKADWEARLGLSPSKTTTDKGNAQPAKKKP